MATAQLACTYAALILHDDGQDITGDKISTLVKAAGVNVEAYWPKLFAKAIEGQDITSFFNFGGSSSAGSAAQSAPVEAAKPAAKQQPKKDDKKAKKQVPPPPKEEEEEGGMGGLFD